MVDIPMKVEKPVDSQTVLSINRKYIQKPNDTSNILELNNGKKRAGCNTSQGAYNTPNQVSNAPTASAGNNIKVTDMVLPRLINTVQKGQKVPLEANRKLSGIKACLGWNVKNPQCDLDVSAFMLGSNGKVLGDSWFVFYGQEKSPDNSISFHVSQNGDREYVTMDLTRINPNVSKIVFVLTINEALEKKLNFSMIKDAYIRIIDCESNSEIVSFMMDEYYSNVTSMMIGEMYLHNGLWKFNAVGSGVARDLAGLCDLYGVQVG